MDKAETTDLYHASYLVVNGCSLDGVECIPLAGNLGCKLRFSGDNLDSLSQAWFEKKAVVNLWAFRTAYNQVNSLVHQAKKNHSYAARQATSQGGNHG